jgi:hypothetical protein
MKLSFLSLNTRLAWPSGQPLSTRFNSQMAPPASGNGPNNLVFWSGDDVAEVTPARDDDDGDTVASNHDDAVGPNDHESMYVTLFERESCTCSTLAWEIDRSVAQGCAK